MRFRYFKCLIIVFQLVLIMNGLVHGSTLNESKANILYLNSYKNGYYWSDQIVEGIKSVAENYPRQNLYIEYLDAKRIPLSLNSSDFIHFFEKKYSSLNFDIVVTSDNDALDFVLANKNSRIFRDKPLVSCGVSNIDDYPIDIPNFFMVFESNNFTPTLDAIKSLSPLADTVYIFLDNTKTSNIYLKQLQDIHSSGKYSFKLKFVFSINIEDLDNQVSAIKLPSVIYYISSNQDSKLNPVDPVFLASLVVKKAKVPVYAGYFTTIIEEFLGGGLTQGFNHGKQTAEIFEKVLFDSLKSNKRQVIYPEFEMVFNYNTLKKWNINLKNIPNKATIIREPESFLHKHRNLLFVITPIIILLLIIIVILQKYNLDHKKFENELVIAKNKANEANSLKSAFLANISHEFRTPLNSIIGFSDVIIEEEVSSPTKDYVKIISTNALRLDHIINHVFDFSLLEAHQISINEEEFSIHSFMQNIYNEQKTRNFQNKIDLQFILTNDNNNDVDNIIKADRAKIYQVLNHLIGNAFDFTDNGIVSIHYQVKINKSIAIFDSNELKGNLIIVVNDTGIGIEPEFQKIIFEPFRHVNEDFTNANRGVGLGLSICKSLVDLMNGRIELESEILSGSSFKLIIPVKIIAT